MIPLIILTVGAAIAAVSGAPRPDGGHHTALEHHGVHHGGHVEVHHGGHEIQHGGHSVHVGHHGGGYHGGGHHGFHVGYEHHHAPPKYEFAYGVHDPYHGTNFGHSEHRDGYHTKGQYYVHLPDGRLQKVSYYTDEWGYHPTVTYEGKAHFPSHVPSHGYH